MSKEFEQIEEGDKKAWEHAVRSMSDEWLTDDEKERLVLIAVYTATEIQKRKNGVPEKELLALLEWANGVRMTEGLLQNVLEGGLFVEMKGKEPVFWMTPKGEQQAIKASEQMGLPPLKRKPDDQ